MTYEQAVQQMWAIAYHRNIYAREHEGKHCRCEKCLEHLEAMKLGEVAVAEDVVT